MFPHDRALMIFVKNPELGRVKTRLAREIGDEKALKVYLRLRKMTIETASRVQNTDLQVWYSEYSETDDGIDPDRFSKKVQSGRDLGERMKHAFQDLFDHGFRKGVIIGSDCPDLTHDLIEKAFKLLDDHPLVIGPARDGGYYLLGIREMHEELFDAIPWSTDQVLELTLSRAKELGLSAGLLETLSDLDTLEDLEKSKL